MQVRFLSRQSGERDLKKNYTIAGSRPQTTETSSAPVPAGHRITQYLPYLIAILPAAILLAISIGRYYGMSKEMLLFRHMAREIVQGTPLVYLGVHYDAIVSPYAFLLAGAFSILGCNDFAVQVLSAILLLSASVLCGRVAEHLSGREYGWSVSILMSLSASMVFHVYTFSEHTFTAFFFFSFLCTFLYAFWKKSPLFYGIAGILLAISVMHYPRVMSYYVIILPVLATELCRRRVVFAIVSCTATAVVAGMGAFIILEIAAFLFCYHQHIPAGRILMWTVIAAYFALIVLAGLLLRSRIHLDEDDCRRLKCVALFALATLAVMGPVDAFVTMDYNGLFGDFQRFAYTEYGIPTGTHGRLTPVASLFPGFDLTITPLLGSLYLAVTAPYYTKLGGLAEYKNLFMFHWNNLGPLVFLLLSIGVIQIGFRIWRSIRANPITDRRLPFSFLAIFLVITTPLLCATPDHRAIVLMAPLVPFVAAYPVGWILRRSIRASAVIGVGATLAAFLILSTHGALWINYICWKPYRDNHLVSAKYWAPSGAILLDNHYPALIEEIVKDCHGHPSRTNHQSALLFCGHGFRGMNFTATWYAQKRIDVRPQLTALHSAFWLWTPDRVKAYANMLSRNNPSLRNLYIADPSPRDHRHSEDITPVITKFPAFTGQPPYIQYPHLDSETCEHVWVFRIPVNRPAVEGDYLFSQPADGGRMPNLFINSGFEDPTEATSMGMNWIVTGENADSRMTLANKGNNRCLVIAKPGRTIVSQAIPGSHLVYAAPVIQFDAVAIGSVDIVIEVESRAGSQTLRDQLAMNLGPNGTIRSLDSRTTVHSEPLPGGAFRIRTVGLFAGRSPSSRILPSHEWDFPELHMTIVRFHVIPRVESTRLELDNMLFAER